MDCWTNKYQVCLKNSHIFRLYDDIHVEIEWTVGPINVIRFYDQEKHVEIEWTVEPYKYQETKCTFYVCVHHSPV